MSLGMSLVLSEPNLPLTHESAISLSINLNVLTELLLCAMACICTMPLSDRAGGDALDS